MIDQSCKLKLILCDVRVKDKICYDSNISPTYRRCPVRLRMSNSVQWMQRFVLLDTLCPTWASALMLSFLLRLKYFSDILRTSGRTPDVQLCAMAMAFFALSDNLRPTRPSVPMFSLFVMIQIFL